MARHILQLEVPDTYCEGVFLVNDISIYTNTLPVTCMNLQITPPGYSSPTVIVPTQENFKLILNACTLGLMAPGGCGELCPNIPDGIYNIYYSISPNTQVFVEYQYLRITHAMNMRNNLLCELNMPCCLPSKELEYDIKNLDLIKSFLLSAQLNVGVAHQPEDGINMYRYALQLMEKMRKRKPKCVSR
jgi:hypothetical protein